MPRIDWTEIMLYSGYTLALLGLTTAALIFLANSL